jgi:hypothetical protein
LGHAVVMDQTRMAKDFFYSKQKGRRKVGRYSLRWLEDVENEQILKGSEDGV